jgi:multidrug efflux pump subunit AcrB
MEDNPGMSAREATRRAMQQITGPVVATTLVLAAIFVPVAFLGGITGQIYRQFALTIAISVILSGMQALSLSPALCALILRRPQHNNLGLLSRFNRLLERTRTHYGDVVGWLSRRLGGSPGFLPGGGSGLFPRQRAAA